MHTLYLTNRKTCSLSHNSIVVIDFIQSLVITVVSVQIHQTLPCLSSPTFPLSGSQTLRLHSCVSPLPPLAASGSPSHSLRSLASQAGSPTLQCELHEPESWPSWLSTVSKGPSTEPWLSRCSVNANWRSKQVWVNTKQTVIPTPTDTSLGRSTDWHL